MRAMALAGESALAEETREQFGLSKDTLDIDSVDAAAQRALSADTYLPLQLPAEAVLFVDDESAISRFVCFQLDWNSGVVGQIACLMFQHLDWSVHPQQKAVEVTAKPDSS